MYAGIIEAIFAAEDDEDGEYDYDISHVGLSEVDFSFSFWAFSFETGKDKSTLNHMLKSL